MQDPACELPRILIPRTWMNKGMRPEPLRTLASCPLRERLPVGLPIGLPIHRLYVGSVRGLKDVL
jgi:hypothetical protein